MRQSKIYWAEEYDGKIRRANPDGSNPEDFITGLSAPTFVVVESSGGYIYWGDHGTDKIQRADLEDGGNITDLVTSVGEPRGLALDLPSGHMYYANNANNRIYRADLDGSNPTIMLGYSLSTPSHIAIINDMIYFSDHTFQSMRRMHKNIPAGETYNNRTDIASVFTADSITLPQDIKFHPDSQKIFFSSNGSPPWIRQCDSDGSNIINVIPSGFDDLHHHIIDTSGQKVYWVDNDKLQIRRANLDGTNVEIIKGGSSWCSDTRTIALDEPNGKIYWLTEANYVRRGDISGYNINNENLLYDTYFLRNPYGLALDLSARKIYMTDYDFGKIYRLNMDIPSGEVYNQRTDMEEVVGNVLENPVAANLVMSVNKLYWVDFATASIRRSNLDGSNIEIILESGISEVWNLAIHEPSGRLYWGDVSLALIKTCKLDGSDLQTLPITGALAAPRDIGIDTTNDKIYWLDNSSDRIARCDLDGSNREDVLYGYNTSSYALEVDSVNGMIYSADQSYDNVFRFPTTMPSGFAYNTRFDVETIISPTVTWPIGCRIDPSGNKFYWIDYYDRTISRCDLDGSNIEKVVSHGAGKALYRIDLDVVNRKIYWTDGTFGMIQKCNMDMPSGENHLNRSDIELLLDYANDGVSGPYGLAIDSSGYIYWTDTGQDRIRRANLDGSGVTTIYNYDISNIYDLQWHEGSQKLYYTDTGAEHFARMNGDGTEREILGHRYLADNARDIAIDEASGYMFWCDIESHMIMRSDINGSGATPVVNIDLKTPQGLVFEPSGQKIYWVDNSNPYTLSRADAYGKNSNIETIMSFPSGSFSAANGQLAIDTSGQRLWWTDGGYENICTAKFDGSDAKYFDCGTNPLGIALHVASGFVFWSEDTTNKIVRGNMDFTQPNGSGVIDILATSLYGTERLAIDETTDTLYIINDQTNKIEKCDLDGGNRSDVASSAGSSPFGIGLHVASGLIYYSDYAQHNIRRIQTDGLNDTEIIAANLLFSNLISLRIDPSGSELYLVETNLEKLYKCDLDGSNLVEVSGITWSTSNVDIHSGYLYYAQFEGYASPNVPIRRLNLSTLAVEDFLKTSTGPICNQVNHIFINVSGNKLYWTDNSYDKAIWEASLDGENPRQVIGPRFGDTYGIEYCPENGKVYWAESYSSDDRIMRCDIDGKYAECLVHRASRGMSISPPSVPYKVAIDYSGGSIYWTDHGKNQIYKADLDGANPDADFLIGLSNPKGIAFDNVNRKLYWTDDSDDKIYRCDPDGSNVTEIVTSLGQPLDIKIHEPSGLLFFTDTGVDKVRRCDLNGSGLIDIISTDDSPFCIAIDPSGDKIYLGEATANRIRKMDLNGSGVETIVEVETAYPVAMFFDTSGNKLYWFDLNDWYDNIRRCDPDGSGIEDVIERIDTYPNSIAVDSSGTKIYWTDTSWDFIGRCDMDGTNIERLVAPKRITPHPKDLALSPSGDKLYWNDYTRSPIYRVLRADVGTSGAASNIEEVFVPNQSYKYGFAIDPSGDKIYFSDENADIICRSDLNGSGVELLVIEARTQPSPLYLSNPRGMAIDPSGNKMYWVGTGGHVRRANLDGSEVETLLTEVGSTYCVQLDIAAGKIYFANVSGPLGFYRANLDGSNAEVLFDGVDYNMHYFVLDIPNYKVYWGDNGAGKIMTCTMDGSGIQDFVTGNITFPNGVTIANNKLYWADNTTKRIERVDLPSGDNRQIMKDFNTNAFYGMQYNPGDDKIYWMTPIVSNVSTFESYSRMDTSIYRMNPEIPSGETSYNRTDAEVALQCVQFSPIAMDVDFSGGKIYMLSSYDNAMGRCNLDGSNFEYLIESSRSSKVLNWQFDFDPSGNHLYIANFHTDNKEIIRVPKQDLISLDDIESIFGGNLQQIKDLKVDYSGGKIYYTDSEVPRAIMRCNLDGSHPEILYSSADYDLSTPAFIDLDLYNRKVYWGDESSMKTCRASMDGPSGSHIHDVEEIIHYLYKNYSCALDPSGGYLYVIKIEDPSTDSWIGRVTINDTYATQQAEILVSGSETPMSNPRGIQLDIAQGKMYWLDIGTEKIYRANMNSPSSGEVLVTGISTTAYRMTLDLVNDKMYWIKYNDGEIHMADLDGQNQVTIASGLGSPYCLDFCDANEKLYFVDLTGGAGNRRIMRLDKDGSNLTEIMTEMTINPIGLSLDLNDRQIYWGNHLADPDGSIMRMDMDSSQAEVIVTGEDMPYGVYADVLANITTYIPLHTLNSETINQSGTLTIHGRAATSGDISLYINADVHESGAITLGEIGHETISGAITLHEHGHQPTNSGITLAIEGHEPLSSGVTLYINGHEDIDSDDDLFPESLFVWGHLEISDGSVGLLITGIPVPEEGMLNRLIKTADHNPQAIGNFSSGPVSVTIEVWNVIGGANEKLTLADDTCYPIGNTGRWGWSTAHLPASHGNVGQYVFKMTGDTAEVFTGEFFLDSPEHGKWKMPRDRNDFLV